MSEPLAQFHDGGERRTRIICTIGPACRDYQKIVALIHAGMDVARLHFSYADQTEHAENIQRIRQAARDAGREVKILQDLSGSKIRLKTLVEESVVLKEDAAFTLTSRQVEGTGAIASITIPEFIQVVEPGDTILLNDGALLLKALSVSKTDVHCQVIVGGTIKSRQAVYVPGKAAPIPVPTTKDRDDVLFGIYHQVDWIAQSYATSAEEINALRDFIRQQNADIPIVAKIERRAALNNLENIVRAADMVMVARGDLGLETSIEEIALEQKHIIHCAKNAGKPVITATEMLFSMMENNRPTRAEVADITNAIIDGSDAVMLSGESAMGKFPIEATAMMSRIASVTDNYLANLAAKNDCEPQFNFIETVQVD